MIIYSQNVKKHLKLPYKCFIYYMNTLAKQL